MSRRNNRPKVEEKPIESIDYLEDLVNTSIAQPVETQKEPSIIAEAPVTVEESAPRGAAGVNGLTNEKFEYKVKVLHPSLRIRRAPNTQAEVVGLITDQGIYTILDEVNGWGMIDENKWIMLSYTQITTK